MLFQSLPFLVFFAVVYSGYLLVKGTRLRLPWLLVSSYVFYAWLSPLYLIPLAYATVVDYFVAGRIESSPRKRAWLTLSILNNVLVLGFFKYAGFVAEKSTPCSRR
jgi:D-alanyl-lipoteichoic acid acyltransferase DltB (MBOAT superfamily)